ncbi:MAG: c-type cytochrome [Crocinitomicaceae bacterium]|nr:c-type cytochrome [Crocinitomicaceae bacterium]
MKYFLYPTFLLILISCSGDLNNNLSKIEIEESVYLGPDTSKIPEGPEGEMIRYGKDLIVNTAYYIGPDGVNGQYLGNKMNCTNCHLDAGTRPYGFNFFSTYANYPQYRSRENSVLTIEQRINNCVERPHNGVPLPLDSKEMIAITAYIQFLGRGVPIGETMLGSQGIDLQFPDRAADPENGKAIFLAECASCHLTNGEGVFTPDEVTYVYPPIWGPYSYQPGSSMFRIIKAARFIKANMPNDKATWQNPYLTDEQALDVAAYINSPEHFRPNNGGLDYKDSSTKYVDYPFGPYDDPFSQNQHKYGPFQEIIEYRKNHDLYLNY